MNQSTAWVGYYYGVALTAVLSWQARPDQSNTNSYATIAQKLIIDTVGIAFPLCLFLAPSLYKWNKERSTGSRKATNRKKEWRLREGIQSTTDTKFCSVCVSEVGSAHIFKKKNLQKNEKNNVVGDMRKLVIGITGVHGLRKMSWQDNDTRNVRDEKYDFHGRSEKKDVTHKVTKWHRCTLCIKKHIVLSFFMNFTFNEPNCARHSVSLQPSATCSLFEAVFNKHAGCKRYHSRQ